MKWVPKPFRITSIRTSDLLSVAWSSLRRNRLRSTLTIGAISVGIGVSAYLISFGLGLQRLTLDSVAQSDSLLTLTVRPTSDTINPLTPAAVEDLRDIPNTRYVLPKFVLKGSVQLEQQRTTTTINLVDGEYFAGSEEAALTVGRAYREDDASSVVVTSGLLQLFGLDPERVPLVTFSLRLDPEAYPNVAPLPVLTVSGVIDATSVAVYLPRKYGESLIGAVPSYDSARIRVDRVESIEEVARHIVRQGYRVEAIVDTVEQINQVFGWIRAVLGALGMIAIVVASIGMFNTLTVSLLERTKEIGIMKALGVRRGDVRRLFLAEALLMGALGGVGGIILAMIGQQVTYIALSILASLFQGTVPQSFVKSPSCYSGFFALAIVVAMITGMYPAQRAAKTNPIDAIRYE